MNDPFNEQISEFIDDEMSVEEGEFFVRRLQRDESARGLYRRYHLIGTAVRGEHMLSASAEFGRRLGQALDADAGKPSAMRLGNWAARVGIAASFALVVLVGIKLADTGPVVPNADDTRRLVEVSGEATGIAYLMQHAAYTSGMSRTILQSSMLTSQFPELADNAEANR